MKIYSRADASSSQITSLLPVYATAAVRDIDAILCSQHGDYELMQMAGRAAFRLLLKCWPELSRMSIVVGGGNNGGDGLVIARLALQQGIRVQLIYGLKVGSIDEVHSTLQSESAAFRHLRTTVLESGAEALLSEELFDGDSGQQSGILFDGDIIVDALYGIGLSGDLREPGPALINAINEAELPVFAVDCPSGLNCDTGAPLETTVVADMTCTFIALKQGLVTNEAANYVGELHLEPLVESDYNKGCTGRPEDSVADFLVDRDTALSFRPLRQAVAHKGDFGTVLCLGGEEGMGGAIVLASESCSVGGAGIVMCATRTAHVTAGLSRNPEIMWRGAESRHEILELLERADCLALGPGLGKGPWGQMTWQTAVDSARAEDLPCVLDADGLNLLAESNTEPGQDWCLTPHPGEAATLLNRLERTDADETGHSLQWTAASVNADRYDALRRLCTGYGCCVLLKGAGSLVGWSEGGDGKIDKRVRVAVVASAHPALASGGMGDVLTGLVAALISQGLETWKAAVLALHLQMEAAERLCQVDDAASASKASDGGRQLAALREPAVTASRLVESL